jgi:hypothetical protein
MARQTRQFPQGKYVLRTPHDTIKISNSLLYGEKMSHHKNMILFLCKWTKLDAATQEAKTFGGTVGDFEERWRGVSDDTPRF